MCRWSVWETGVYSVFSGDQMDIHGKIQEVLAETLRDDQGPAHRTLSETDFLCALRRRGIVDDVMKDLHFTQVVFFKLHTL